MNWLDILLLVIIGASVVAGIAKGFARAVTGVVAMLLGLFCGLWFYGIPGGWLREYLSSQQLANFLGFMLIFVGFLVAGGLVAALLARALKIAHLSGMDRLAGGAFGTLRGVLVAAAVVTAIMAFAPKSPPQSVAHSSVTPYVMYGARAMVAAAPREVKDGFRNSYERVKEIWSGAHKPQRLPGKDI